MPNEIQEIINNAENTINENCTLLRAVKDYCKDKADVSPNMRHVIAGLNVILEKQEKTLEIISDIKASC